MTIINWLFNKNKSSTFLLYVFLGSTLIVIEKWVWTDLYWTPSCILPFILPYICTLYIISQCIFWCVIVLYCSLWLYLWALCVSAQCVPCFSRWGYYISWSTSFGSRLGACPLCRVWSGLRLAMGCFSSPWDQPPAPQNKKILLTATLTSADVQVRH